VITADGLYSLDIDLYHTQACCDGPSVSSSSLRAIMHGCPQKWYATSDLNPARMKKKETVALNFGRAAHALVLGEPEFKSKFIISPYADFRTKEAQLWRDSQTKQVVRIEEMETVNAMAKAQREAPQVMRAFSEGKPEMSLIWKDPETGVWLKSRPDWLPTHPAIRFACEYKTCISIEPRKLSNDVFKYGYEMQAALALDGIATVLDVKPLGMAHVVQEKDVPYLCDMRLFTTEQIEFGRMQYRKALHIFARCLETGIWPGYTTEPRYFDTPWWVTKTMENFDDDNGYAGAGFDDDTSEGAID